uniref:CPG4 domain-containing protein n=1 Tax=Toxocara canis TaxID=6265 RepID=A0A183TX61_TOXCA
LLSELRELVEKRGKKGFEAICSAGKHFNDCGRGKLTDCFDVDVLMKKLKLKHAEAWALNVTVFVLTYECSHKEFDDNFDCLHSTALHKKEVLTRCERRFREDIKKHGMPCKQVLFVLLVLAGQTFLNCISSPFKRACGKDPASAVCELEKAILLAYMPHARPCPFHCVEEALVDKLHGLSAAKAISIRLHPFNAPCETDHIRTLFMFGCNRSPLGRCFTF